MVKYSRYPVLFSCLLVLIPLSQLSGQSLTAEEIIKNSSEACKSLDYIEYRSSSDMGNITVEAHVIQQKASVENVGLGHSKVIVKGDRVMGEETQPFEFSYDGEKFKFHELGKGDIKTIDDPEPATVGRTLGLFYFNMVHSYLTSDKALDFLLERADKIELLGEVMLEAGPAYEVAITQTFTNPATKKKSESTASWFFDKESYLPVKRVNGSVVLLTDFLSLKTPDTKLSFDINAEEGRGEKLITGNEPNTEGLAEVGTALPDFSLADADGQLKSLAQVKGKVTVIDFWGTWCGPCLMAMPKMQALYEKYKDQGLQVVGISVNDKPGKAEKFVEKKGYSYEFLVQGTAYARKLGLNTFPTVYIVDEKGLILHAEKGNRKGAQADFEAIIQQQIKATDHE